MIGSCFDVDFCINGVLFYLKESEKREEEKVVSANDVNNVTSQISSKISGSSFDGII